MGSVRNGMKTLRFGFVLLFLTVTLPVQAAMDLFTLRIPAPPAAKENALLKEALAIELVRLSGEGTLPVGAQALLQAPRRFVARIVYLPLEQAGGLVGQQLEVHFARAPLLKAMEQVGLTYWPLSMRPKVMVALVWSAQGQAVPVTPDVMQVRPDLNIEPLLYQLGLPHQVPRQADDSLFHRPVLSMARVKAEIKGLDGVVRLYASDSLRESPERVAVDWESLLPTWPDQATGHARGPNTLEAVRRVFLELMAHWRQRYEAVASVEGDATLKVQAPDAARLLAFDAAIQTLKPFVVQAQMTQVRKGEAIYDVVYQGTWETLVRALQQRLAAQVVASDPVEQMLTVELLPQASVPEDSNGEGQP